MRASATHWCTALLVAPDRKGAKIREPPGGRRGPEGKTFPPPEPRSRTGSPLVRCSAEGGRAGEKAGADFGLKPKAQEAPGSSQNGDFPASTFFHDA